MLFNWNVSNFVTIVKMGKFGTKMSIILLTEEKEKNKIFYLVGARRSRQ